MNTRLVRLRSAFPEIREAAPVAAAFLLSAAVGASLSHPRFGLLLLTGLFASGMLWIFSRTPLVAVLVVVLGMSSIVYEGVLPRISIGIVSVTPVEVTLALGLLAGTASLLRAQRRTISAEGTFLTIFFVGTAIGLATGASHGAAWHNAFLASRPIAFYAVFWLARPLLSDPGMRRKTLFVLALVAASVALLQFIQFALGPSHSLFLVGTSPDLLSTQTNLPTSVLRVRPPGLVLVYVACSFAAAYLLWGPRVHRVYAVALFAITFTGIALSLNRNMLLGLAAGVAIALIAAPGVRRILVLLSGVTLIALVALALSASGSGPGASIVTRFASLGNWSQLDQGTLADRYYENRLALSQIKKHPFTGIGWGTSYGAVTKSPSGDQVRNFIHNQYLGIWMRTGLLGLIGLLGALVAGLRHGLRFMRVHSASDAWIGAGAVIAIIAIATSSTVGIYMMEADAIVPLGILLGLTSILGTVPSSRRFWDK